MDIWQVSRYLGRFRSVLYPIRNCRLIVTTVWVLTVDFEFSYFWVSDFSVFQNDLFFFILRTEVDIVRFSDFCLTIAPFLAGGDGVREESVLTVPPWGPLLAVNFMGANCSVVSVLLVLLLDTFMTGGWPLKSVNCALLWFGSMGEGRGLVWCCGGVLQRTLFPIWTSQSRDWLGKSRGTECVRFKCFRFKEDVLRRLEPFFGPVLFWARVELAGPEGTWPENARSKRRLFSSTEPSSARPSLKAPT